MHINGDVNYTGRNIRPFHDSVHAIVNKPGIVVASPAGPAIGCSEDTLCDIKWNVELGNNPCPCAFNISCCVSGLTLSYWWKWDLLQTSSYRYFLNFGGIYRFYQPGVHDLGMNYRIYGSPDRKWWNTIPPQFGTWQHVVIMVQSTTMTVYLDGRFYMEKGLSTADINKWFPGATRLIPRLELSRVEGNYSLGQLLTWENWESKRNPVYLWRQHYEEVDTNDPEFWW